MTRLGLSVRYWAANAYVVLCLGSVVLANGLLGYGVFATLVGAIPSLGIFKVDRLWASYIGASRWGKIPGRANGVPGSACEYCTNWCLASTELNEPCNCGCKDERHAEVAA